MGKTRYTHYSMAYHLVWIAKYRRRVLVGEVQAETQRLMAECCQRQGLTLLAVETDEDHIHVLVSAAALQSGLDCQIAQGIDVSVLTREVSPSQKGMWKGASLDAKL